MTDLLLSDMRYCVVTAALTSKGIPEFVINFRPTIAPIEYATVSPALFKNWLLFNELPQEIQDGIMQAAKVWLIAKRLSGELSSEYRMDYG